MVNHGPSKGCKTCRSRKIKCDETKPFCHKCASSGRMCLGYGSGLAKVLQTDLHAMRTHVFQTNGHEHPVKPIAKALSVPNDQQALSYFFGHMAPCLPGYWIDAVPSIMSQTRAPNLFKRAVTAMCYNFMSLDPKRAFFRPLAIEEYSAVVQEARPMLSDPRHLDDEYLMMTLYLCVMFEMGHLLALEPCDLTVHVRGLKSIIENKSSDAVRSSIFGQFHRETLAHVIYPAIDRADPAAVTWILGVQAMSPEDCQIEEEDGSDNDFAALALHCVNVPELLHQTDVIFQRIHTSWTSFADDGFALLNRLLAEDASLVHWINKYPRRTPTEVIELIPPSSPTNSSCEDRKPPPPDQSDNNTNNDNDKLNPPSSSRPVDDDLNLFPTQLHSYTTFVSASTSISHRLIRIKLLTSIARLARMLNTPSSSLTADEAESTIRALVDDICACVPYFMFPDVGAHERRKWYPHAPGMQGELPTQIGPRLISGMTQLLLGLGRASEVEIVGKGRRQWLRGYMTLLARNPEVMQAKAMNLDDDSESGSCLGRLV